MPVVPILALAGCVRPLAEVADAERPWWGDTAALERAEGLDLVEVEAGEPIGYWPRITVRHDRVDLDDRAWFLALPSDVLALPGADELLVDETVLRLQDGRVPHPTDDHVVAELRDRLQELRRAMRRFGVESAGEIVVVPEPSVPQDTLLRAWFSAGQAGFEQPVLAGAASGRLRGVNESAPWCPTVVRLEMSAASTVVDRAGRIFRGADGGCPSLPLDAASTALALAKACAPAWDRVAALHPEAAKDDGWRCLAVQPVMAPSIDAGTVLATLGRLDTDPAVTVRPLAARFWDLPAPSCDNALTLAALDDTALDAVCAGPGVERWIGGDHRRTVSRVPWPEEERAR